jgi:hypothetical protein
VTIEKEMLSDYRIEVFDQHKFLLMKELFQSAYGVTIDKDYFFKKYTTENLGHPVIGFIAIHISTNSPAAFYGVFPLQVLINGKKILAAQSGDTMTHRSHQKKGLFVHLAQMTFEECSKRGIEIVFGLPNKNSYHGFTKKLHWQQLDEVIRYDLKSPVKRLPLRKISKKLGWNKLYHRYVDIALKNYTVQEPNDFTNSRTTYYGKIHRNKSYLNYKSDNEKFFIRLENVIFWIKLTDVFWIGDVSDYEKMDLKILSQLKRIAFRLGYNTISFHINNSIGRLPFLENFKKYEAEPLCFYYINKELENMNLLINGADFDTW